MVSLRPERESVLADGGTPVPETEEVVVDLVEDCVSYTS